MAYGFDSAQAVVWLEPVDPGAIDAVRSGMVCRRHADSLTAPRGWWLDDRRLAHPTLFATGRPAAPAGTGRRRAPTRPTRPAGSPDLTGELPFPVADETGRPVAEASAAGDPAAGIKHREGSEWDVAPVGEGAGATVDPDETRALAWSPHFDQSDDLGGLLRASSPLLSRAFGSPPPRGGGPTAAGPTAPDG